MHSGVRGRNRSRKRSSILDLRRTELATQKDKGLRRTDSWPHPVNVQVVGRLPFQFVVDMKTKTCILKARL